MMEKKGATVVVEALRRRFYGGQSWDSLKKEVQEVILSTAFEILVGC